MKIGRLGVNFPFDGIEILGAYCFSFAHAFV
jgi:hypothetical protein